MACQNRNYIRDAMCIPYTTSLYCMCTPSTAYVMTLFIVHIIRHGAPTAYTTYVSPLLHHAKHSHTTLTTYTVYVMSRLHRAYQIWVSNMRILQTPVYQYNGNWKCGCIEVHRCIHRCNNNQSIIYLTKNCTKKTDKMYIVYLYVMDWCILNKQMIIDNIIIQYLYVNNLSQFHWTQKNNTILLQLHQHRTMRHTTCNDDDIIGVLMISMWRGRNYLF